MISKIAELRTRIQLSVGQVVLAIMNLPRYRHQTLADLMHVVLDPLMRDRVAIAYTRTDGKPERLR
jgi:hemolysin-activating ACP:hemolysin acyltransferase